MRAPVWGAIRAAGARVLGATRSALNPDLVCTLQHQPPPHKDRQQPIASNEPPAEVVDLFFNVAAAKVNSLLAAALGPTDTELARLLSERAVSIR